MKKLETALGPKPTESASAQVAETEGSEREDEEQEEKSEEDEEEEEEEEQEEEEVEEEVKVKKRRCQRRKKLAPVCLDSEADFLEEDEEGFVEVDDEEEDDEGEEGEETESEIISTDSSVFSAITFEWENEIYEFEELCDPGNINTIYRRYPVEPNLTDETGVLRYLHVCKVLAIAPMMRFLQALYTNEIDLSYRQISSTSIRAMCAALEANTRVKNLILRFNKLIKEDCFYLALMLRFNESITLIDLTGCCIGPSGIEEFIRHLSRNEVLVDLNLSKCCIQDEGMKMLSNVLVHNNSIQNLDLSYNKLGEEAAEALGFALKINRSIQNLNLRYNNLFDPVAMKGFFRGIASNDSITHLNLAWNAMSGPDVGGQIGNFLRRNASILYLDLSDNRLEGAAIAEIKRGLARSRTLETIKLGRNPISAEDLDFVLSGAKVCSSLKVLDLEDLWVKKSFIKILKKIQAEREFEVNIGGMYGNYEVHGPDYAKVILRRAQFEAMKPKSAKKRKDFGHLMWTLGEEPLTEEQFMTLVRKFKAKISKELFPELIKQFMIPKVQLIDVVEMKRKYLSIFPDSTPPPPPKTKGKGQVKEPVQEPVESVLGAGEREEFEAQIFEESEEGEGEYKGSEEGDEIYAEESEAGTDAGLLFSESEEIEQEDLGETGEDVTKEEG